MLLQSVHIRAYKQAQRRDDDIAIVNACFWMQRAGNGQVSQVYKCPYTAHQPEKYFADTLGIWWYGANNNTSKEN